LLFIGSTSVKFETSFEFILSWMEVVMLQTCNTNREKILKTPKTPTMSY